MKINRLFRGDLHKYFIPIISGVFIVSFTGYMAEDMNYGLISLVSGSILCIYFLGVLYFHLRPPIKIQILSFGDYKSTNANDLGFHGKPSIRFYIVNSGDGNSLNPFINISYTLFKNEKSKIIPRLKRENRLFKLKTNSVKEWSLPPNEPIEFVAICDEGIPISPILFPRLMFTFDGGGKKQLLFFRQISGGGTGFFCFWFFYIRYCLLKNYDFIDQNT